MNGFWQGQTSFDGVLDEESDSKYLMLAAGFGWSNENVQTLLEYQVTVSGKNINATDTLLLTLIYTF